MRWRVQQAEQVALGGVIGAGRVARCRPNAPVLLADERVVIELLASGVAPVASTHFAVKPLGASLGQPVGERLEHDGAVVVVRGLELGELRFDTNAGGNGESADPVRCALGRYKIGQAVMRFAGRSFLLLTQSLPDHADPFPRFVGVDLDIVADGIGRVKAEDGVGG